MQGLLNPVSILLHVLNAAVLFVAIYFLLYRPVKRFLDKRKAGIAEDLEHARTMRAEADDLVVKGKAEQSEAYRSSTNKAAQMQAQAEENARQIVEAARDEAHRIIQEAKKSVEDSAESHKQEMRDLAASMAVEISAKILGREITGEDHRRLIDEFLKEVN